MHLTSSLVRYEVVSTDFLDLFVIKVDTTVYQFFFEASRMFLIRAPCSHGYMREVLNEQTFIPASIKLLNFSILSLAGPIVATIFSFTQLLHLRNYEIPFPNNLTLRRLRLLDIL
ncbi:hypothetical protein CW304_04965 [Bacillus sp. UFRGS-B20]|nr:hypothetical protein CW304_04965 [Bacillus sp. UFRGS-B20]